MNETAQILVFLLGERRFGLHLSQVERVIRAVDITPLPGAPGIVSGAIDLHGTVIAVLNIRRRFGLAERAVAPEDYFVIARIAPASGPRTVALVVDGVQDVMARAAGDLVAAGEIAPGLDGSEARQGAITGAMQLEDGLILIHDLERFLSQQEERELAQSLAREMTRPWAALGTEAEA